LIYGFYGFIIVTAFLLSCQIQIFLTLNPFVTFGTSCHFLSLWHLALFCHFLALIGTRILLTALFFSDMVKIGSLAGTSLLFLRRSFMKKIIAVFAALAVCSSLVFALPVSAALNNPVQTKTEISKPEVSNDFTASAFAEDGLFASVNAAPLTNEEAQAVEGEGPVGIAVLGFIGGLGGGILGYQGGATLGSFLHSVGFNNTQAGLTVSVIGGGVLGATAGATIGARAGAWVGGFLPF
jgi:hypothetical protein